MKKCNTCQEIKELTNFHFRKDTNKYRNDCKFCSNNNCKKNYYSNIKTSKEKYNKLLESNKIWYNNNVEKAKKISNTWQKNNLDKVKAKKIRYRNNPKNQKTEKEYYLNNKKDYNARTAKRRAKQLKATPAWANENTIKEIYRNCPPGYHVDHIIPLQGKNVSGLHIAINLQYLPAHENLSKSNKIKA